MYSTMNAQTMQIDASSNEKFTRKQTEKNRNEKENKMKNQNNDLCNVRTEHLTLIN